MSVSADSFGKVAVLMGGRSAEREISLRSGDAVLSALLRSGVDAVGIDTGEGVFNQLDGAGFERAFIILHGRGGEDGTMQGALQTLGLPYTGSGVLGSSLAMEKHRTKVLWRGLSLPTPDAVLLETEEDLNQADALGYPLIIKPSAEGSSIGMSKVENREQLQQAWQIASEYDSRVLAERWVVGAEYTAGFLQGEMLPLIRLETPHQFYDYQAKYSADTTRYLCPCGLPEAEEAQLQSLCRKAYETVGASGWGRVDLMLDEQHQPWLIEVNTVPGMTDHSLVPMAAKAAGIGFDELVMRILQTSHEQQVAS
ncbi:MAG: D-alanine--D-alanine ligase [Candidatus Thiodiazotropha lotti]|uniref:D-alanine--D-alanine ligase n=1 Tax=Candidatus Thiodiazotropha endoloripes TaxID=1818881 RepID=A0A1E2UJ38_9GAMM|nr:D-alanine--D-alanine ligase [Candidatus Thiodiazotropha endoloripes]MCG7897634.1 D-alanine--D-alanine ligase [Candidatus Thiodiazotropha weberae]MCG7986048.1 D-alanine--D-alanine ligase [Candidatus Thiodiazotropha lotti]MCG7903257.1 D-alanine--D-alanine ligase [Candidatus Thiodiazotropha weberae]MCG7912473.1 D-alanine--D-alanine ligase [Candidatus Thiodiazotropha weberae]MCG7992893.1 D-alanine--D-alanine ligase [Candidatus Thiodiazotropha lotti]